MVAVAGSDPAVPTALFGGAIEAQLPRRFADVSDFRPVPDHQEVFADADRDESLIIEILSRVEKEDAACGAFFFHDLAEANESVATELTSVQPMEAGEVPGAGASFCCVAQGTQVVAKHREAQGLVRGEAHNTVQLLVGVVRLPQVETDLLITLNTPLHIGEGSSSTAAAGSGPTPEALGQAGVGGGAEGTLRGVLCTLKIVDWGLFG